MDEGGGVLSGQTMADTFNALRANDLIWSFFVNNYLMGKEPRPFDLLFWNADQTRMPKALHLFYLRKFYRDNALAKGELVLGGVRLDLKKVKIPIYVQSRKEDHIAPYRSVYKGARLFGGPVQLHDGRLRPHRRRDQRARPPRNTSTGPTRALPPTRRGMDRRARRNTPAPGGRTGRRGWPSASGRKIPARDPSQGPAASRSRTRPEAM